MDKLKRISEEEIYLNELNNSNSWNNLCYHYKLNEDIIEQFSDKVGFMYP